MEQSFFSAFQTLGGVICITSSVPPLSSTCLAMYFSIFSKLQPITTIFFTSAESDRLNISWLNILSSVGSGAGCAWAFFCSSAASFSNIIISPTIITQKIKKTAIDIMPTAKPPVLCALCVSANFVSISLLLSAFLAKVLSLTNTPL